MCIVMRSDRATITSLQQVPDVVRHTTQWYHEWRSD